MDAKPSAGRTWRRFQERKKEKGKGPTPLSPPFTFAFLLLAFTPYEDPCVFIQLKKEFLGRPIGERIDLAEGEARSVIDNGIAEAVSASDAFNQLMSKTL